MAERPSSAPRDKRVHDQLADPQSPCIGIDEHALHLRRAVSRLHQRAAADHAAIVPGHEKRDIVLLERADIDQMIALGRVKRGHIGVGKVDEAQNRILPGCFKLDFGGQCDACLLYKMRISS